MALNSQTTHWKWLEDDNIWHLYDDATINQIEAAYNSGALSVTLTKGPYFGRYENQINAVIFDRNQNPHKFSQRNKQTNNSRTVRRELQQQSCLSRSTLTQISKRLNEYGFNQPVIDHALKIFNTKHNKNENILNNTEYIINAVMNIIQVIQQHQLNSNNDDDDDDDDDAKVPSRPHDPYYSGYNVGDWIEILNHDVWVPAEITKTKALKDNELLGFERSKIIYAEYQDTKTLKNSEIILHGLKDKNKLRVLGSGFYSDAHSFNFEYDKNNKQNNAKNAKHPAAYINRQCFHCKGSGSRIYMRKKKNVQSYPCLKCSATGTVRLQCNKCKDGIFKAAFSMNHDRCNGRGCGGCNDTGLFPLQDWKCRVCKGSGEWKTVKCGTCKGTKVYTPPQNNNESGKQMKCNNCIAGYFLNKIVEFTPTGGARDSMNAHGQTGHTNVVRLYHATDKAGAEGIKAEGVMVRGQSGSYGGGIYFAESAQTAKGRARQFGYLVIADVYVGKYKDEKFISPEMNFMALNAMGYDSIKGKWSQHGIEYVVYNWDQVWVHVVVSFDKIDCSKLK